MDIPTQHQVKIAKQTLRYSDAGALIMGGMTKAQARDVLRTKAGWSQARINAWENPREMSRERIVESVEALAHYDNLAQRGT